MNTETLMFQVGFPVLAWLILSEIWSHQYGSRARGYLLGLVFPFIFGVAVVIKILAAWLGAWMA